MNLTFHNYINYKCAKTSCLGYTESCINEGARFCMVLDKLQFDDLLFLCLFKNCVLFYGGGGSHKIE